MIDPFEDPRDMDPANWACCDEHEAVFRQGDVCPKCEPEPEDMTDSQATPAERYPWMPDEDASS